MSAEEHRVIMEKLAWLQSQRERMHPADRRLLDLVVKENKPVALKREPEKVEVTQDARS